MPRGRRADCIRDKRHQGTQRIGQGAYVTTAAERVAKPGLAAISGPFIRARKALARLTGDGDSARIQREALLAFAVRILSAGILYLSQIVLARWMGGVEYGIYVFVWTWILVLGGLSSLGLATVMIRMLPEYRERGQLDLLRGLLYHGRLTAFGSATLVAALGLAGLLLFGTVIAKPYILPAYLALVCIPMIALSDMHDGIGRGGGWMAISLVPPYVLRPLLVLITMTGAHELGFNLCAETAVGAAVVATWLALIVQTALLRRRLGAEIPAGPRVRRPDLWLKTSLPLLAITGSELLLQNTDVLVIAWFLKPEQGAIYFAAAKTMALVMFVHYAVGSAVAKRFSALNALGERQELARFVREAVNWTFWPSLAAAALLLAMGKPLLWLFGPQFTDGYPVMFVLVLGFLGRAAMGPSEFVLNMLGEQKACAAVIASMAALNIALQVLLVPAFGILGAASATATVLILGALLNTFVARRRIGIDIAIWNNWRRS